MGRWHRSAAEIYCGSKVIKFSGRQLHVAPSFHLCLTTTDPPNTISPSLSTTTTVINCASSLPLSQEVLLDTAFHVFHEQWWAELRKAVGGVAKYRSEVTKLERELFESVGRQGREEEGGYWWSTEKIAKIMAAKKEVTLEMTSHMEKLRDLLALRSRLLPLAHHAALMRSLLHRLPDHLGRPYYRTSWESYLAVCTSALKGYHTNAPELMTASVGEGRTEAMMAGVIQTVNKAVLQDAIRFLDHHDWVVFAMCMTLLVHCRPHQDTALVMDQLLYLSQGLSYLEELDISDQLPTNPACVSKELWCKLHKLPVDREYFRQVVQSMHSSPNFWERLQQAHDESSDINVFPWRKGEGDDNPITLNDFILWSCINWEAVVQLLHKEASVLLQSTSAPTLADILNRTSGQSGEPMLFLSEEESVVSDTNFYNLEEELRTQLQGRSLRVLRLGAGLEAKASDLLAQPNSDSLLLVGVHHGSVEWLELLLWRVRQAINTGCLVMLTTGVAATHNLPPNLLRACRVVLLSNVVFSPTQSLPRSIWTRENPPFHHVLQFLFASIPNAVISQCNTLPQELRPVLFGLTVLHTAITAEERYPVGWYLPPSFYTFLASIQHLLLEAKKSSTRDITVHSLQAYVKEVYSSCVAGERLDQLITACLNNPPAGTSITLSESVRVTVPLSSVHPRQYVEHVKRNEDDSSGASTSSPADIVSSSVHHLLPVFAAIPGTDHDFISITPHPSTFSPSLVDLGRVREVLETCLEQLPSPLPLRGACGAGEILDRALPVCAQLPSAEQYRAYALYTAVCQFNSALSTIRHDVAVLVHSAAVGFDSLPREMVAILKAVWSGRMPLKWCKGVCCEAVSLKDGMTALQKLSTLLRTNYHSKCTAQK